MADHLSSGISLNQFNPRQIYAATQGSNVTYLMTGILKNCNGRSAKFGNFSKLI